ncbi:MAG: alpha/beta hydrolase [Pseudomonadota bacterium]|nr:alpha/beta hydrolase [Pseudomonadota bacterium]
MSRSPMRYIIAGICLWLGLSASGQASTQYRFEVGACSFREQGWFDPERMDCGTVVAVEPGVDQPIRVPALRLLRQDPASQAAPVVFVNGGPGGSGVTEVDDWLEHPLRQRHDLILFDARGTGQASPLPCPELGASVLSLIARDLVAENEAQARMQLVRECLAAIPAPLRGVFTTQHMARDIDAIRRMFGYERVSLFAVSYGTRVAAAFAAAHPGNLDRLVLDSVVPQRAYYPEIGRNFEAALARTFAQCEAALACRARFPRFRGQYGEVLAALQTRPIRLHMPGGRYADDSVTLNAQDFSLLMQQLLYGDELIPTIPLLIEGLHGGSSAPLALFFEMAVGMRVSTLNFAAYYLVLGNDEAPLVHADRRPKPAAAALAFYAQDLQLLDALDMFRGDAMPVVAAAAAYAGPLLVVAGGLDPITAPAYGQVFARGAPRARYLEFPSSGHAPGLADRCARESVVAFLSGDDGAPACTLALQSPQWAVEVYRSAWPRNWLEAMVLPRSMLPLAWFGALVLVYALLALGVPLGAAYRRLRGPRVVDAMRPVERRALALAYAGLMAGGLLLTGLCALLFKTITAAAPALLVFGLPPAGYGLAALAVALVVLTALLVLVLWRAWRSGGLQRRPHLWLATVAAINLGLIGFLIRWQVFIPG